MLLILDEVATGFGRTGTMFACEQEGVSPDLLCLAKGLTGGYLPLAATLTTQQIFDGFCAPYGEKKSFFHGHSYTANPLACAAALANLQCFRRERTLKRLRPKITLLRRELALLRSLPHVGDIRQVGFMVGIELMQDPARGTPYPYEAKIGIRTILEARRRGLIIRPLGNVIVLMPPLTISQKTSSEWSALSATPSGPQRSNALCGCDALIGISFLLAPSLRATNESAAISSSLS